MTYFQAVVIALIQGVTEMFPISSLGHSVLVPAWFGGSWQSLVTQSSAANSESSFYLAYIVALHCATALALLWFFRADWVRIIRGFLRSLPASVRLSLRERRPRLSVQDKDERLAWMIIFATIPVGLTGLALEHSFRTLFAKPAAAAVFLFVNGLILLGAEMLRRSAVLRKPAVAQAAAARTVQSYAPADMPWEEAPGYTSAADVAYPATSQQAGLSGRSTGHPRLPAGRGGRGGRGGIRAAPRAVRWARRCRHRRGGAVGRTDLATLLRGRHPDRGHADPRAVRRDQPLRRHHGRRAVARS